MKRKHVILLLAIVAVLIFTPGIILDGVNRSLQQQRERSVEYRFKGTVSMWHIGDTGAEWLNECVKRFSKQYIYTFIDVQVLSAQEANELLKQGQTPDILSFPMGYPTAGFKFVPLSAPGVLPAYKNTCQNVYPYMSDFYVLACEQASLMSDSFDVPLDYMSEQTFKTLKIKLEKKQFGDPRRAIKHLMLKGKPNIVSKSVHMICPYSSAPAEYLKYPISTYTDMVYLAGVTAKGDKGEMCKKFVAYLLEAKRQQALEKFNLLPTTEVDVYNEDWLLYEMYVKIGQEGVVPSYKDHEKLVSKK